MKIGIIGLGQCGTTIVNEWSKVSTFSYATINTSSIDENKADNIKNKHLILNGHLGGMAKDRTQILSSIQRDKENFLSFIRTFIKNNNLNGLILVASSGGGSGSGLITELVKLLENKISLRCIVISPSFFEGFSSLKNSLDVFTELQAYNTAIRVVSNENYKGNRNEIEKREIINKYIINTEESFLMASSKESLTNNIDEAETMKLLFTKGFSSIYTLALKEETNLTSDFINCLKSSFDVGISKDKYLTNLGIIYTGNIKTLKCIDEIKLDEVVGVPQNKFTALFSSCDLRISMCISGSNMSETLEEYQKEAIILSEKVGKQKFTNLRISHDISNNENEIESFKSEIFSNKIELPIKVEDKKDNWLDDLDL